MRVRILLTNGNRTIDIFWLTHDGNDVYAGTPNIDEKFSYHGSGKVHRKSSGKVTSESWQMPLSKLKKQCHITTLGFGNLKGSLKAASDKFDYKGKKGDSILTVDSRSFAENDQINIYIGLLEPNNFRTLKALIANRSVKGHMNTNTIQLLLSTSVDPWVYAIVAKVEIT